MSGRYLGQEAPKHAELPADEKEHFWREATAPGSTVRRGGYLVAVLIHKTPGRASPRLVPSPSASRSNFHAYVSHRRGRTDAFEAGKQEEREYGHQGKPKHYQRPA